jgi:hypothetical protein
MQSRYLKQVAYNDRVVEAEKEMASINTDVLDFLVGMTLDASEEVVICVNGSEEMKREEEAVAGQLWMQGNRQMTAYNLPFEGMANSRESAILSAVAEAVTWEHAMEVDGPRKGLRVVIYPKELTQLEQVLSTGDPSVDSEDGHPIAYTTIIQAAQSYERMPLFLREDYEQITSNPTWSVEVPKWLNTASRVATGSRRRVLENGPDVMRSDEEDALKDEHGEELTGMYAPGCISLEQAKMTPEQAAEQRAALASGEPPSSPPETGTIVPFREPISRSQTPVTGSSDDDDPNGPGTIWSPSRGIFRQNKNRKVPAAPQKALPGPEMKALLAPEPMKALPAPTKGENVTQKKSVPPPQPVSAPKPKGTAQRTSRPKPTTEAQASKPMETRKQAASRAGSLRSGGGSGQTDTCVAQGNPSKT